MAKNKTSNKELDAVSLLINDKVPNAKDLSSENDHYDSYHLVGEEAEEDKTTLLENYCKFN